MKRFFLALVAALQFSFAFCAPVPLWVLDVDSAFPKDKYIARLGSGSSAENARADAVAQIASFFKSRVVVNTSASSSMKNDGDTTTKTQGIDQSVQVASDMTLTAVEYKAPYYDKKKRTYYVAAYIERRQGWQLAEAESMRLKTKYDSLLSMAKKAADPITSFKYFSNAKTAREDLLSALNVGFLFDPSKEKEFRGLVSELYQNQDLDALGSCQILTLLESSGDCENIITSKVVEVFKKHNFSAGAGSKKNYEAVLKIEIENNEKSSDEIYTIMPQISITLSSKDGKNVYYSYQNSWGKTANFSLAQAQKKAFPKIAEELKVAIDLDFKKKFLEK